MPVIKSVWNCKRSTFVQAIILWQIRLWECCWNTVMKMLEKNKFNTRTCFLWLQGTVYPKKYAHGFCFAVLCCGYTLTDFPISIKLTSLALWQSNDCPSASKATLMNMDKYFMWIHYERFHNHNKAKHNKPVCIFLGIYCRLGLSETHTPVSNRKLIHKLSWAEMVTCLKFDCFVLYLKFTKKYQLSFKDTCFIKRSISSTLNLMQNYSNRTQRYRGFHFIRVGSCDEAESLLIRTLCWTRQVS